MDLRAAAIEAARRNNLDPDLFLRLIQQESGFQPHVTSSAGAYGPAQLMPGTAADLGVDPRDPLQNLEGGARYLRQQMDTFGDPRLALAAYNAGPGAVQKYGGVPPFAETQNYVASILGGPASNLTVSSKGGTGMGLLDMPTQQPRTLMDRIRSPETTDNLLAWVNSMRTNPDPNIGTMIENRQARRAESEAMNRTAQFLRTRGHDDLADALETGSIAAGSAVNEALSRERPADPMDALNMQIKQLELQNLQNPQPEFRRATQEEAAAYGAEGGQFGPDGRFYAVDVPQGMTIESDGAGGFRMVQGVGVGGKPATEGQLAGAGYLQRMTAAESILRDIETQANVVAIPLEKTLLLGTKLEGYALNPTEQRVAQAQRDWVRAKLRKESGAVIGPEEMAAEIQTYFPLPGESQETIAQKAESRRRAERQMQIGSGSAAEQAGTISPSYSSPIRMDELGRKGVGGAAAGGGTGQPVVIDGVTIRKVN